MSSGSSSFVGAAMRTSFTLVAILASVVTLVSCNNEASPVAPLPPAAEVVQASEVSTATALALQAVSDAIDTLSAGGVLSPSLIGALRTRVSIARTAFESGRTKQAQAILSALHHQVLGFVSGAVLTAAQAAPLVAAVGNAVAGGLSLVSVATGETHACGLSVDGEAWCWGYNAYGQLGDGSLTNRSLAAPVVTDLRFASLTAGGFHTCGVTAAGAAYCWGRNDFGQLGNGTREGSTVPVRVQGDVTWASVDGAFPLSCGLTTDGVTYCWGSNQYGALGASSVSETCPFGTIPIPCSSTPVAVSGNPSFRSISTGLLSSCGLDAAGTARCWGWGTFGELGDGIKSGCTVAPGMRCSVTPVAVLGGPFSSVTAGGAFACALTTASAAFCWGFNSFGQLGNGTTTWSYVPVAVAGGHSFRAVVPTKGNTILGHACGLTVSGQAFCWGSNAYGQLGANPDEVCPAENNLSPACSTTPYPVDGGITFATVSPGNGFTCGVDVGRGTFCWGWNNVGQVGDGTNVNRAAPTRVVAP
jgi:alpha-tubulin suppressor-like RCC1 family protein